MAGTIFYRINPILISLAFFVLLLAAKEVVYRLKSRTLARPGAAAETEANIFLSAVLTLLSLLLGFTYAFSQGSYDTRRRLVISEANAVGTAYLRTQALPQPQRDEIQALFRRYVAIRLEIASIEEDSLEKAQEFDVRSKELQNAIWSQAASLAQEMPTAILSIFLQALNEVIDLHAERLAAYRFRVPFSIYFVLFGVSVAALGLTGDYYGARRRRGDLLTSLLAILVAMVMWVILDLDNPVHGAIRVSQQSYVDLQKDIGPPAGEALKLPE